MRRHLCLVGFLFLSACSDSTGGSAGVEAEAEVEVDVTTTAGVTGQSSVLAPPDGDAQQAEQSGSSEQASTPVQGQLDWFVGVLNSGEPPTESDVSARFAPSFLAEVPPDVAVLTIVQIASSLAAPAVVHDVSVVDQAGLGLSALLEDADGQRLRLTLGVLESDGHLIETLLIQPEAPESLTSFDAPEDAERALAGFAPVSAVGVFRVEDGHCLPMHELGVSSPIPLGSVFKLWVLGAVAETIQSGELSWDDEVVIRDEWKSTPDGEVSPLASGSTKTVRELAEVMIAISDNSATDHLIHLVGRENVEAMMTTMGVADPSLNVPLMTTGDLFELKFIAGDPDAARFRSLDSGEQRLVLDDIADETLVWVADPSRLAEPNAEGVLISQPRDLDVEWFATPADLCRTMVYLDTQSQAHELAAVAEILEINPGGGIPFDTERWPTIRFKGGSEPGVVAGAWWFESAEGDQYVVAGGLSNPEEPLDEVNAIITLASAITLVD